MRLGAEFLGEGFRALKLCRRLGRPEGFDPGRRQIIHQPRNQWRFRPNHHKADAFVTAKRNHIGRARDIQQNIGATLCGAGITGRDKQGFQQRALFKFPSQRVLPPAGTD